MIVHALSLFILSLTLATSRSIPRPRQNQRSLVNPAANAPLRVDRQFQESSLHSNSPLRRQSLPIVLLDDEADKSRVIDIEELKDIFNKVESNRNRDRYESNPEPENRYNDDEDIKVFEWNPKLGNTGKLPVNNGFKTFDYEIVDTEPNTGTLKKKNKDKYETLYKGDLLDDAGMGKDKYDSNDVINIQILDLNDLKNAKSKNKNSQNLDILDLNRVNRPYSAKYKTENPVETVWDEYNRFKIPLSKQESKGDSMTNLENLLGEITQQVPKKNGNANKRFKTSQDDINSILLNLNEVNSKDDKTNYQIINLDNLFDSDRSEKDSNKKAYDTKDTTETLNLVDLLELMQNADPKDTSNKDNLKILNLDEDQNTNNIYDKILDIVQQDQETSKGNGAKSKKINLIDLDSLFDGNNKLYDSASDFIDLDRLTSEKDLKAAREANLRTLMQKVDLEDLTKNIKNDVNNLKDTANTNLDNNKELSKVFGNKGMVFITEPTKNHDKQLNYVLDKAVWLDNKNNQKAGLRRPRPSNAEIKRLRELALGHARTSEGNSPDRANGRLRRDEDNEELINFDDLVV